MRTGKRAVFVLMTVAVLTGMSGCTGQGQMSAKPVELYGGLNHYTALLENGEVIHCEEPVNQRYLREMAYFLGYACKGRGESINSPAMAQKVLGLTLGETL